MIISTMLTKSSSFTGDDKSKLMRKDCLKKTAFYIPTPTDTDARMHACTHSHTHAQTDRLFPSLSVSIGSLPLLLCVSLLITCRDTHTHKRPAIQNSEMDKGCLENPLICE